MITWHTEKRKLSDLIEWGRNPRQLSKHDAEHIKRSLEKFGVADPLVVNTDNLIIGGHQRKRILQMIAEADPNYEVDVRIPDRTLTDEEVAELNIRLNKNSGSWDWDVLANEFELPDLVEWGFEPFELGINNEPAPEFKEYDESVADDVEFIECPNCGHKWPK